MVSALCCCFGGSAKPASLPPLPSVKDAKSSQHSNESRKKIFVDGAASACVGSSVQPDQRVPASVATTVKDVHEEEVQPDNAGSSCASAAASASAQISRALPQPTGERFGNDNCEGPVGNPQFMDLQQASVAVLKALTKHATQDGGGEAAPGDGSRFVPATGARCVIQAMSPGQLQAELGELLYIGQGATGLVYRASLTHSCDGVTNGAVTEPVSVAVKFMICNTPQQLWQRAKEALLSKLVSHPNLVRTLAMDVTLVTPNTYRDWGSRVQHTRASVDAGSAAPRAPSAEGPLPSAVFAAARAPPSTAPPGRTGGPMPRCLEAAACVHSYTVGPAGNGCAAAATTCDPHRSQSQHQQQQEGMQQQEGTDVEQQHHHQSHGWAARGPMPTHPPQLTHPPQPSREAGLAVSARVRQRLQPRTLDGLLPNGGGCGVTPLVGGCGVTPLVGGCGMTPLVGGCGVTPLAGGCGVTPLAGGPGATTGSPESPASERPCTVGPSELWRACSASSVSCLGSVAGSKAPSAALDPSSSWAQQPPGSGSGPGPGSAEATARTLSSCALADRSPTPESRGPPVGGTPAAVTFGRAAAAPPGFADAGAAGAASKAVGSAGADAGPRQGCGGISAQARAPQPQASTGQVLPSGAVGPAAAEIPPGSMMVATAGGGGAKPAAPLAVVCGHGDGAASSSTSSLGPLEGVRSRADGGAKMGSCEGPPLSGAVESIRRIAFAGPVGESGGGGGGGGGGTRQSETVPFQDVLYHLEALPGRFLAKVIMEYCDSGTLLQRINAGDFMAHPDRGPLAMLSALRALLWCLREVASGMAHLHSLNIIHGDLKPGNVLLTSHMGSPLGYLCKVSDFGLATALEASEQTITHENWGTVVYMAPESCAGRCRKASDVYSFGVLLWQMCTGERPYAGMQAGQVLLGVKSGTLSLQWPTWANKSLVKVGQACLRFEPKERPGFKGIRSALAKIATRMDAKIAAVEAAGLYEGALLPAVSGAAATVQQDGEQRQPEEEPGSNQQGAERPIRPQVEGTRDGDGEQGRISGGGHLHGGGGGLPMGCSDAAAAAAAAGALRLLKA